MTTQKCLRSAILVAVLGCYTVIQAQENHSIHFQSGVLSEVTISAVSKQAEQYANWQDYTFESHAYYILQFEALPDAKTRSALLLQGVELLDYFPNYAYLARGPQWIPPGQFSARAVLPLQPLYKLGRKLTTELEASPEGVLSLRALPMPGISARKLSEALQQVGVHTSETDAFSVFLDAPKSAIVQLASHPALYFLELAPPPPTPEGEQANALMRANWQSPATAGNYDGDNVVIGIADDGTVNHADKKGRLINMTGINWGTHGDMTTGIAIGAGNIDPLACGLAPAATVQLSLINGYPQIQNAVQYYQEYQTITTSTSYGESCGGYYSSATQFIDNQVFSNANLMHHFSAGNSGSSGCSSVYGFIADPDGRHFGNITGGYKAGKNVITVGNATFGDILSPSSSRGPLEDGRLKPDLCGIGQGSLTTDDNNQYRLGSGTSAAAPAIAGVYAVLVQAYRSLHNNQDPPSALLKAALLNTAEDLGRPGPDYEHGWGRVNGRRALSLLEQQQYQSASMNQNVMQSHSIYVPPGTKELRVMLYWHDPAASPLAANSLVNDLDLSLQGPNNAIYLPYRLSTFPHIDSLTLPAYAGVDRVNNMEQVVLKNPAQGNYNARAFGHLIPHGPQPYYVVYTIIQDEISIVYPGGGESLAPGETRSLYWDAPGNQGTFTLQYSVNGGVSWATIASNVAGHLRYYDWTIPSVATGTARIRVTRNGQTSTGGDFSILGAPDFHITSSGAATARMFWEPVAGANQYDVYALGNKFMGVIASTGSTSIDIPVSTTQGNWYTVRARHTGGATSRRAYAKYYEHHPCEGQVTLTLKLDGAPGQVKWRITDQSGSLLASGGPYSNALANQLLTLPLCLPQGCHIFTIEDSGNNGLCCAAGQGYFQLHNAQGQLLASGSSFGASISANFCLQAGQTPLQVTINASPSTACFDSSDGWAIAFASGGSGNYSFHWSTGATTQQVNGLSAGQYAVTVSAGSSTVVATATIGQPAPLNLGILAQPASCSNSSSGMASATVSGGTPPYSFQWSNGATTPQISGLAPGNYQVTTTDSRGCTETAYAQVQAPVPLNISLSTFAPSCSDAQDGQIFATVSGGAGSYTYQWNTGSSSAILQNIGAGAYSLSITDSQGCTKTATVSLQAPTPLSLQANITQDGQSVSLSAGGGTAPYQFQWPDGNTSASASGLEPGDYLVTVTDSHNCLATTAFTINEPSAGPCLSQGSNSAYNWIASVQLGAMQNNSGNNGGYASFANAANLQSTFEAGQTISIMLSPGFYSNSFVVNWAAWIDFNEDGDYEDNGEQVLPTQSSNNNISTSITIPAGAMPGLKSMRISMAFGLAPLPCEGFVYGEVEDYSINITTGDITYCTSAGQNTAYEWIEHVSLGSLNNTSGNDGGYGDYSGLTLTALSGAAIPFMLQPGYSSSPFPESWSIWIDYNQNGQFESNQEMAYGIAPTPNAISGQFTLPDNLAEGAYRMRIIMRWGTSFNACELYNWGETEDYTLQVITPVAPLVSSKGSEVLSGKIVGMPLPPVEIEASPTPQLFPNPAGPQVRVRYYLPIAGQVTLQLFDATGHAREVRHLEGEAGWSEADFNTAQLPAGTYFMIIKTQESKWVERFVVGRI